MHWVKYSTEPKIIGMYDINVKTLICTNIRKKFKKNRKFLSQVLEDEILSHMVVHNFLSPPAPKRTITTQD